MKTFREVFEEIIIKDELKKEYEDAVKFNAVEAFLKKHDCDATLEDVKAFFHEQNRNMAEMTEKELTAVAGGFPTGDCTAPYSSGILPWECDPNYSSLIDKDGHIRPILVCA